MCMCAKCNQNKPCGSRVMNSFTNCQLMDRQTYTVIIVQTLVKCNLDFHGRRTHIDHFELLFNLVSRFRH